MTLLSIEAIIDVDGQLRLSEPLHLAHPCRAIITILDDSGLPETALLSEDALAQDWDLEEEDAAWSHLQQEP